MNGFPSPFGGGGDGDDPFDAYDSFVPGHLPEPGPFLADHDVLAGDDHAAFHRLTRALFEARGVYDVTFDYNLARLNLDSRHPDAGYRYAVDDADPAVLRAAFTPTTPFCPQSRALTVGSFRAWNDLADRHEFDLVRVRVAPMHHDAAAIDEELAGLAAQFRETGDVRRVDAGRGGSGDAVGDGQGGSGDAVGDGAGDGSARSPF